MIQGMIQWRLASPWMLVLFASAINFVLHVEQFSFYASRVLEDALTLPVIHNPQNTSDTLPDWLKEYLPWHHQQRQVWNETTWRSHRFLILTCQHDRNCGGTADRLHPSLALLKLAAQTNRIFLIQWETPAPLETFLVPPEGGIDWRVPEWFQPILTKRRSPASNFVGIQTLAEGRSILVPTQYQSPTYGMDYYNSNLPAGEKKMDDALAEIWKILFTPAPTVAAKIQEQLDHLQLIPGHYVGVHLRTYTIQPDQGNHQRMQGNTENAIHCASQLLQAPGEPIFFASDSNNATRLAVEYGNSKNATVKTIPGDPIHLGFVHNATDESMLLSNVFVDLYLLSMGKCVTYGSGGFGRLAHLMNGNGCGFRHGKRGRKCSFSDTARIG